MKFIETDIKDALIIEPVRHGDARGYFSETYRADLLEAAVGRHIDFIQDNESCSCRGVVRGLHYQAGEASQAKLVRCSSGAIMDVIVDLRLSSPSFGKYIAVELSSDNGRQLFIPRGCAHGFAVLSPSAVFQYKVDNYWSPAAERTLLWNDPSLAIPWPIAAEELRLSDKDKTGTPWHLCEKFD